MKTLLFVCCFLSAARCMNSQEVYICSSKYARKYHLKPNCRGLSDCQYRIVKTTLDSAENNHKALCNWEKPASVSVQDHQIPE